MNVVGTKTKIHVLTTIILEGAFDSKSKYCGICKY